VTAAQDEARAVAVGAYEFDHPKMIRARRLWAELLRRDGTLAEGDLELVTYMHVETIRDRLMADVLDPWALDKGDYDDLFRGAIRPDAEMIQRMHAATMACRNLSELTPEGDHPPLLLIVAMCQWLTLNAHVAKMGASIALTIDPEFRLAQLMVTMVDRGLVPKWAELEA